MKRVVLIAALLATACGGGEAPQMAAAPKKLRFAVIPKSLDIPVFNYAKVGAEREAAKRGDVEVIWRGSENADQLRQKEILESFITQHVDGIAISCLNGDFLTDTINRAVDAGIERRRRMMEYFCGSAGLHDAARRRGKNIPSSAA